MSKGIDLEILREIFKDDTAHISLALVSRVQFADDATAVYVDCTLFPDSREIQATMTWDSVGASTASGDMPDVGDLVLIVLADRENEHAFVIKRLASADEPLPLQIKDGHLVHKAKPGKKLILGSDTRVEVGKGVAATPPTEPMVLGTVLLTYLTTLETALDTILTKLTTPALAPISSAPGVLATWGPTFLTDLAAVKVQLAADKNTYLTQAASNIVSQTVFTER